MRSFCLARDTSFLDAQARACSSDIRVSLQTIQDAITAAMRGDHSLEMAEFCFAHSRRLSFITQQSPLDALRGGDLGRAWGLADTFEIKLSSLWHLLLSWELEDSGRIALAHATLERLQEKKLTHLQGWMGRNSDLPPELLTHALRVNPGQFADLLNRLVHETNRHWLSGSLNASDGSHAKKDKPPTSFGSEPSHLFDADPPELAFAITEALAGRHETARSAFSAAVETAGRTVDFELQGFQMCEIAAAQARAGYFADAEHTAKQTQWDITRAMAFKSIATAHVQTGTLKAARTMLAVSFSPARDEEAAWKEIKMGGWMQNVVIEDISWALVQSGRFDEAMRFAQGRRVVSEQLHAVAAIVSALAEIGDLVLAGSIADSIIRKGEVADTHRKSQVEESYKRAQRAIAAARMRAGEFSAAIEGASKIKGSFEPGETIRLLLESMRATEHFDAACSAALTAGYDHEWIRAKMLEWTAIRQALRGDFDSALFTAYEIKGDSLRWEALRRIAVEGANVGSGELAHRIFESVADAAQQAEARPEWRAEELGKTANAQAGAGDSAGARRSFAVALSIANGTSNADDREKCLWVVARFQARGRAIIEAMETAQKIESMSGRAIAIVGVVHELAKSGQFDLAISTAQQLHDEERRASLLADIGEMQAHSGHGSQSVQTAAMIQSEKNWGLMQIGGALSKAGDRKNFKFLLPMFSYHVDVAFRVWGYLARLYPEHAKSLADTMPEEVSQSSS